MEFLNWLGELYNFPYLIPAIIGILLFAVEIVTGGLSDLGIDLDFDTDTDFDLDVDLDVDADFDLHIQFLSWLGVGKAPISVLIEVACVSFGLTGLLINAVAYDIFSWGPWLAMPVSLAGSLFMMVTATKFVGAAFTRFMPSDSSTSSPAAKLVGETGRAITNITSDFGQVAISGATLNVRSKNPIPRDSLVIVFEYDAERNHFYVEPLDQA